MISVWRDSETQINSDKNNKLNTVYLQELLLKLGYIDDNNELKAKVGQGRLSMKNWDVSEILFEIVCRKNVSLRNFGAGCFMLHKFIKFLLTIVDIVPVQKSTDMWKMYC